MNSVFFWMYFTFAPYHPAIGEKHPAKVTAVYPQELVRREKNTRMFVARWA